MLAPSRLPTSYARWNRKWKAPFGSSLRRVVPKAAQSWPPVARSIGPFAFQANNDTRAFEYPWVHESLQGKAGMRVLEIGGGLSGLQFALSQQGLKVVNIDPGTEARGRGWPVSPTAFERLNRIFGTSVELRNCFIEEAAVEEEAYDAVISVSAIEHIPHDDLTRVLQGARRALVPGGRLIITVDLFLDVLPFSEAAHNSFGTNISLRWLVEASGLTLTLGNRAELFGFDEFDATGIQQNQQKYLIGKKYPAMVQTLVLTKER